ncbi:MAG TPA: TraR/DksA family transcriptional regulator [Pseudobdellovibrionaceae bacterium]|nr:TraR/DksA family transcriptional regulator [Pseudobdellovibrionaceae bacterium]
MKELKTIKNSLLIQKSEIINKAAEFRNEQQSVVSLADENEAATVVVEKNISIHLHERDRQVLKMIEQALGRMESGTYGQCESCGVDISPKRLLVRPFASLCIDCMEEVEFQNNSLQ